MFFEPYRSTEKDYFKILLAERNKGYPLHIHSTYECYFVRSGEARVTIDDKEYILHAGDAVFVFPYQSHSYVTKENTATWVCIFSPDLVGSYHNTRHVPKSSAFRPTLPLPDKCDGILFRKALCYGICAEFDKNAEYIDSVQGNNSLISKLLFYISENYKNECTLADVSNFVGYDYSYVSKFFKRATGISIKKYVNDMKISEACRMLLRTEKTVREIGDECGFASQRSFNRNFLLSLGKTPVEYRKAARDNK